MKNMRWTVDIVLRRRREKPEEIAERCAAETAKKIEEIWKRHLKKIAP